MRILVVDDELEIRKVLRLLLEKASHTVLEAANGADAVVLDDSGYPTGDLATGCTINIGNIMTTVNAAIANAK